MIDQENREAEAEKRCPSCGRAVPENVPGGLCPVCIMQSAATPPPPQSHQPAQEVASFSAPSSEDIADSFPELKIIGSIAKGGMGAVYHARQPHLDRDVALKVLPPSLAERDEFRERFSREAKVLAKLNHPNIVAIHDFGESHGYFFLIMEFVEGVNLRQAMKTGQFTPEQALSVVPEICSALQFAHDEGILHRDIKPENILLDTKGRVKIADFGIAKLIGEKTSPALTKTAMPGTPQYMAPEQFQDPALVDHRSDIYSLGVVFYEMLTGELPIGRFAPPSRHSQVGKGVDRIVLRSLEKEQERRQQSADQLRSEIITETERTAPSLKTEPASSKPNKSRWMAGVILLVIAFFLTPMAVYFSFERARNMNREKSDYSVWIKTADHYGNMNATRAIVEKNKPGTVAVLLFYDGPVLSPGEKNKMPVGAVYPGEKREWLVTAPLSSRSFHFAFPNSRVSQEAYVQLSEKHGNGKSRSVRRTQAQKAGNAKSISLFDVGHEGKRYKARFEITFTTE